MDASQYAQNPCRCQRTTVSGLMMGSSEEPGTQAIEPNQQKPIDIAQRQPLDMRTDGRAPTLEAAKAKFEASWRQRLAWQSWVRWPGFGYYLTGSPAITVSCVGARLNGSQVWARPSRSITSSTPA